MSSPIKIRVTPPAYEVQSKCVHLVAGLAYLLTVSRARSSLAEERLRLFSLLELGRSAGPVSGKELASENERGLSQRRVSEDRASATVRQETAW